MSKKKIIWLASYPKSGNTWFRIFLSNLLSKNNSPVSINELNTSPNAASRLLFDNFSPLPSSDLSQKEILQLRPEVYKEIVNQAIEDTYLKVHDKWQKDNMGNSLFPKEITKGVIYFVRNPLDIAISFSNHLKKDYDTTIKNMSDPQFSFNYKANKLYTQFNQHISDWSSHVSSWLDKSDLPTHCITYENMHSNTLEVFSDACKFLGIKFTTEEIKEAIRNSSFQKLQEQEMNTGFREKPFGVESFFKYGKPDNWKTLLSEKQIATFQKNHASTMKRFNYM